MNRVGFYTGNIYRNGELPEVGECCTVVTDEELENEEKMNALRIAQKISCIGCNGCSASQTGVRK